MKFIRTKNRQLLIAIIIATFILSGQVNILQAAQLEQYDFAIKTEEITAETMLPIKQFQENGLKIYPLENRQKLLIYNDSMVILKDGQKEIIFNGENKMLDQPPLEINDDILLPFYFAEEFLGVADQKIDRGEASIFKTDQGALQAEIEQQADFLNITITLVNISEQSKRYIFNTGQKYDIAVYEDSQKIYQWSRGKVFTQAIEELTLKPNEKKEWEIQIPSRELSAGTYNLEIWLTDRRSSHKITVENFIID